jgi:hypothetical protein
MMTPGAPCVNNDFLTLALDIFAVLLALDMVVIMWVLLFGKRKAPE